ncbi:hypothetical protein ABPG75_004867 [Micractinium tetrahymenae]
MACLPAAFGQLAIASPAMHGPGAALHLQALPPDLLAATAALLGPHPRWRLLLAASSRTLLAASRQRSPSWWGRLRVMLLRQDSLQRFEAWLANRRPAIRELQVQGGDEYRELAFALPAARKVASSFKQRLCMPSCLPLL